MADEPAKYKIIDNASVAETYANKLVTAALGNILKSISQMQKGRAAKPAG